MKHNYFKKKKEEYIYIFIFIQVFSNEDKTLKDFEKILAHAKRSNLRSH